MDLSALDVDLNQKPFGLIALAGSADDVVRAALWRVLARCETLYWLGPLRDKPVVDGPATCWLLECTLAECPAGLRSILRRDAHAIHVIGPFDDELAPLVANAALSGHVVVVEVDGDSAAAVVDALRRAPVEAHILDACLVGGVGVDGGLALTRA